MFLDRETPRNLSIDPLVVVVARVQCGRRSVQRGGGAKKDEEEEGDLEEPAKKDDLPAARQPAPSGLRPRIRLSDSTRCNDTSDTRLLTYASQIRLQHVISLACKSFMRYEASTLTNCAVYFSHSLS